MKDNRFFLTAFSVVFLDMLGVSIVIPILAPLFLNGGLVAHNQTLILGLLIAVYPAMQFFGAPILGALSDKHGRKPILLISIAGTFIGYVLFAFGIVTQSLLLLFLGRMIDGFTGGNIGVVMSAIADKSKPEEKARNFGLVGMAFGLGFTIGPFLGGLLADPTIVSWFTFSTPFWFAAGLSLVNLLFVALLFRETLAHRRESSVSALTGFRNLRAAFGMKHLRLLFLTVFTLGFGFAFFTQFSQVYYIERFAFTQSEIGWLFGYIGLCIALVQGVLVRLVTKRWAPERIVLVSIPFLALALASILIPTAGWGLYLVSPFIAIFMGLTNPNLMAMVSNLAGPESQGEIIGINQSIQAAAITVPPVIAGIIAMWDFRLPIITSAIVILCAWIVFLSFHRQQKRDVFHEV